MGSWSKTDQEIRLETAFAALEADFKRLDKARDAAKAQALLKDVTARLKDAKALIQEFEREARTDGMPTRELADRKRRLVNRFNSFVALKKQHAATEDGRGELLAGAAAGTPEGAAGGLGQEGLTMQELMKEGRKGVKEIDSSLNRAEKLVEDTMQIGQQTAATLHQQTEQLNKIVDDLNEIEFTMKKAAKIIADIGKGIMTDRCIMFLLFLVVCGVIALVVVKVVKPRRAAIQAAAASITPESVSNVTTAALNGIQTAVHTVTRRRLSRRMLGGGGGGSTDAGGGGDHGSLQGVGAGGSSDGRARASRAGRAAALDAAAAAGRQHARTWAARAAAGPAAAASAAAAGGTAAGR